MALVTVFRHVPPPIIGTVGVIHDREFQAFEERLDWLETHGLPVERFDPATEPGEAAAHEPARQLLSIEGDRCLPLVLVNDAVLLSGGYPSRAQLARAVGRSLGSVPREIGRRLAAIAAAAAIGTEDEVHRQECLARGEGLSEDSVRLAEDTGAAVRHRG
jgi:Arsenical resistance operon protein ArsD